MKKVKSFVFVLFIVMMVCTLTGCGESSKKDSKKSNSDILIATKSEDGSGLGSYKETIEITFKDGKADKVTEKMEFDDESIANYTGSLMQMTASSLDGMEVKQEGKMVTVIMDAQTFVTGLGDADEDLSRDAIEKNLKESGFTIE